MTNIIYNDIIDCEGLDPYDNNEEYHNNMQALNEQQQGCCLSCQKQVKTEEIKQYIENTALCPFCGMNMILPGKYNETEINRLHLEHFCNILDYAGNYIFSEHLYSKKDLKIYNEEFNIDTIQHTDELVGDKLDKLLEEENNLVKEYFDNFV